MIRFLTLLWLTSLAAFPADLVVDLWPDGKAPGAVTPLPESEIKRDDGYRRITNVSRPTLTLFRTKKSSSTPTPAVIICPGGGYRYTVVDKEGSSVAEWLNRAGITALVLKYRTPNNREGALHDVQRALRLVRARSTEWNIDPQRLGISGFSAGGHLAAKASTTFNERSYSPIDDADQQSCRPDFALLIYPAYLDDRHGGVASDLRLGPTIPPTLIIHTEDDKRHVIGSKIYSAALKRLGLTHDFKLYASGGHGYGLYPEGDARIWPRDALAWISKIGIHSNR